MASKLSAVTSTPPKRSASDTTPSGSDSQARSRARRAPSGSPVVRCPASSCPSQTISEEPPPISKRTMLRAWPSARAEQPAVARNASVSRSTISSSKPVSARTRSRKAALLLAARHASVAMSRARVTWRARIFSAQIFKAATVRTIAASASRPVCDTPSPSRTMRQKLSTMRKSAGSVPGSGCRAISRRQLLVPRSSAA